MSIKLTDTQLIILSAAAQREDRCIVASKGLRGGAAQKFAAKLLAAGLVKEIKAKPGMPPWRRDEGAGQSYALKGQSYALKLTAAGLTAIAVDDGDAGKEAPERPSATIDDAADTTEVSGTTSPSESPPSMLAPRDGTKLAQVIGLLRRVHGATLAEVVTATGWLPHTTRAALTGLRKRGYEVTLDRTNKVRGSTYRIGASENVAEDNQTLSGEQPSQSNEPLARAPAASEARAKTAARSVKRERVVRSPKRKAA